jgi:hypothetical protein
MLSHKKLLNSYTTYTALKIVVYSKEVPLYKQYGTQKTQSAKFLFTSLFNKKN